MRHRRIGKLPRTVSYDLPMAAVKQSEAGRAGDAGLGDRHRALCACKVDGTSLSPASACRLTTGGGRREGAEMTDTTPPVQPPPAAARGPRGKVRSPAAVIVF